MDYDFESGRILEEIRKSKAMLVGLQFPEGLKAYAVKVAEEIEGETDAKTFIFLDPVYGACDTKQKQSEMLGLDLVVHFGHTDMQPSFK